MKTQILTALYDLKNKVNWEDDFYTDAYRIAYSLSFLYPENKLTDLEWFCKYVIFQKDKEKEFRYARHNFTYVDNNYFYDSEKKLWNRINEMYKYINSGEPVFE